MIALKYSEILEKNRKLKETLSGGKYQITILSNIITSQLNEVLEYALRTEKINAYVRSGNYDNLLQDSKKCKGSNAVIIFWELANIIDGLQYRANIMGKEQIEDLLSRVKSEIDLVFRNLKDASVIIMNKFSSLIFNHQYIKNNRFDEICKELNNYLERIVPSNIILIDIDKILAKASVEQSVDFRNYYSSKALYSVMFYKHYIEYIKSIFLAVNGKIKKALILDCDNTLWKGILGEDGFDKVEMSCNSKSGVVFEEFQHLVLEFQKRGILIGLCSKNNEEDVNNLIKSHPHMHIKDPHIAIKKLNWDHKPSNLVQISKELNISLDSMVFVDDSEFEINLVRELLPEVTALQVPKELDAYPNLIRKNAGLFFDILTSKEDLRKTELYKQKALRENNKKKFNNLEDYLKSLKLTIDIYINDKTIITRMSQLTQKTNQFNLTTKRYTERDIERFINDENFIVFATGVKDKFGDSGITGLCITELDFANKNAIIDSLLISCRVLGRNIEFAFLNFMIEFLKKAKIKYLSAKYVKTFKNKQAATYYDKYGLHLIKTDNNDKIYRTNLSEFKIKDIKYIKVNHGKQD